MEHLLFLRRLPSSGWDRLDSYVDELVELEDIKKVERWSLHSSQSTRPILSVAYTYENFVQSFNC